MLNYAGDAGDGITEDAEAAGVIRLAEVTVMCVV